MIKNYLKDAYRKIRSTVNKSKEEKDLLAGLEFQLNEKIWIVFAGKTHVGKTTLINELFNPAEKLPLGNGAPGTLKPYTAKADIKLSGDRGEISYTDLPGIGSDLDSKDFNERTSLEYFEKCDIILWIFKCDDTAKEVEQIFYSKLRQEIKDKIVFGLSQVDKATGNWYNSGRQPSKRQKIYILNRMRDISKHFNIPIEKIIPFSCAKNGYGVNKLARMLIYTIEEKGGALSHKIPSELLSEI